MPGITDCKDIYSPSIPESIAMRAEVVAWIKDLKALNVSADIAAFVARDFLSPMRISDQGDVKDRGKGIENEQVSGGTPSLYMPEE